ncbi:hypothetical protein P879_08626, partial [Paragonimus westermani]
VVDIKVLRTRILNLQAQLNECVFGRKTELVFFTDAIRHLVRVSRAIHNPGGHILLVGVAGSGKRSIAKLSARIAGFEIFECLGSSESQAHNFLEDLKVIHKKAADKDIKTVLIITDDKIRDETCYEYVNQLLTIGFVPNLFLRDEYEDLLAHFEEGTPKEHVKTVFGHEEMFEFYQERVRANLHVVLCFSPVGDGFRKRAISYPGILAGCVIDWFGEWPEEALLSVARVYLADFPPVDEAYVNAVVCVHKSVASACNDYYDQYRRPISVTPYTFLTYLEEIKQTYNAFANQLSAYIQRMETGVEKLNEAQHAIDDLRAVLALKETELQEATKKAEGVLRRVMEQSQVAEQVKNRVLQVKGKCESIIHTITTDRLAAREQLEAARPALMEAEEALNTLRPQEIAMLCKLQKPPNLTMRIMDCVLIMFNYRLESVRPDHGRATFAPSWNESLRMMVDQNFLSSLKHYPRYRMNEEIIDLLEPYIQAPEYNVSVARKVCGNVASLLQWTLSMVRFFWVSKEVIPLEDRLSALEQKLVKAKSALSSTEDLLKEKTEILAGVQLEYEAAMIRKLQLEGDTKLCYGRMCRAVQLIEELSSELVRWTSKSLQLKTEIKELGGDSIQMAAFLTYCGAFNQHYRNRLLVEWQMDVIKYSLPHRPKLELTQLFTEQATLHEWALQGLPMDEHSIQNAIITINAHRYPLLIDPQAQGRSWLSSLYSKNIMITSFSDRTFANQLEDALSFGMPFLIEHVTENLNPAITDLIEGNFIEAGGMKFVQLEDKRTVVAPTFKLFLTTHLANPTLPPELGSRVNLIDFSITPQGLEEQLLARVIAVEREKIERSRVELTANVAVNKRQMNQLEENLLNRLVSCKGSLVDDMNLIEMLQNTKNTAQTVAKQLVQAAEAESEIEQAREEYRTIAVRGSVMFFLLSDLATVNRMYQYGLPQFIKLFDDSLIHSEPASSIQRRIARILTYMTVSVWQFATRSLFKRDRLIFTLMLAIRLHQKSGTIRHEELDVLIKAGSSYTLNDCPPKPGRWIPDAVWMNLKALSKLPVFSDIMQHIAVHERLWRNWYEKDSPEESPTPSPYGSDLTPFTRLLLIRCLCLDRFPAQARRFISDALGETFAEDVLLQPEKLLQHATSWTPILNLLSTGADPTLLIEQLARKKSTALHIVAMGQGQEVLAKQAISLAKLEGSWVLLQNCHLSLEYMQELYAVLNESVPRNTLLSGVLTRVTSVGSTNGSVHSQITSPTASAALNTISGNPSVSTQDSFRLWMTTEEHERFPVNLLQTAVKFTNEPPEGIKASLLRTYADITQDCLDACISAEWKVMLYTLALLHCTLQERRKYGSLGWAIPYDFTQTDFTASMQIVQNHIDYVEFTKRNHKTSGIDWKCIQYMIADIQYGGRVTDDFDLRLLNTLTKKFYHEQMFAPEFEVAPNYRVPRLATVAQYEAFIQSLPVRDSPEAFHLHANADIESSTHAGGYIIDCIQAMEPKETVLQESRIEDKQLGSNVRDSQESLVAHACHELLSKLPNSITPHRLRERLETIGLLQPMTIFLRQEIERMNKLLRLVWSTLNDLLLAIEGLIVMSQPLHEAMNAISEAKIPSTWLKFSWESNKLGFWFTELLERCTQLFAWLLETRPISFWMTGFFNPQGFLTALRQEVARKHPGWSLDCMVLVNRVTRMHVDEVREYPTDGIYVHGLYLQGAAWDHRNCRLMESRPKQLFDSLPVVNLTAQLEVSPGVYLGGFTTPEEPPGKFIFRAVKSKRVAPIGVSVRTNVNAGREGKPEDSAAAISVYLPEEPNSGANKYRRTNLSSDNRPKVSIAAPLMPRKEEGNAISHVYIAPVYKNTLRNTDNLITTLKLACPKSSDHWIMRSVAVLGDIR